ncbi:MAG: UDP-3-O-(3-hydroxymyristoyl)glucosamine N-acyltransferase [Cellvibrionaceae bacterium]|nr:UDP-3-O-(3-hydroxymyristoyl)glucosamine N-acyltransferase [Cellvibrionaceae bacterium]
MSSIKAYTLAQLADHIDAQLLGDADHRISNLASLTQATHQHLCFFAQARYKDALATTQAGCVLLRADHQQQFAGNKLLSVDPYLDYARLSALFVEPVSANWGVHPSAVIAADVVLPEHVSIGPQVVIESGCRIGAGTVIGPSSCLGRGVVMGDNCLLHGNVTLYSGVTVGANSILHSGVVIGADGFGFAPCADGWQKIHQLGGVIVGDNVEVGANTTIDRGALTDTLIGDGVKIDNQVQIAHNVQLGENTAIAAAVAIAGSTVIGKNCTVAGCVGIVGHIDIADNVHITGMTMVSKSIREPGSYSSGTPMNQTSLWRKNAARFHQLDQMARQLQLLAKSQTKHT